MLMKLGKVSLSFLLLCSIQTTSSHAEETQDPLETYNRAIFSFNDKLDRYFLKPTAKGYKAITPDVIEIGISNLLGNLLEVRNVLNDALQWKWKQAGNDTGRFLLNSTIGIAGFFDVARHMGLEKGDGEDFAQTLAMWGVEQGPYVVLPLFGPSSVRGAVGLPIDIYTNPTTYIDHVPTRNTVSAVKLIDARAALLDAEQLISGDKYIFLRDAYLQRREYLVNDGEVEDDFGGDFDDYE